MFGGKASIMLAALSLLHSLKIPSLNIPSYMVRPKRSGGAFTWSKRAQQKMKGKKARLNRGKNRGITRRREKKLLRALVRPSPYLSRGRA